MRNLCCRLPGLGIVASYFSSTTATAFLAHPPLHPLILPFFLASSNLLQCAKREVRYRCTFCSSLFCIHHTILLGLSSVFNSSPMPGLRSMIPCGEHKSPYTLSSIRRYVNPSLIDFVLKSINFGNRCCFMPTRYCYHAWHLQDKR